MRRVYAGTARVCAPFRDRSKGWEAAIGCLRRLLAIDKFVQINLELIAAHTVTSADQPLLQVANGAVRQRHCGCGAFAQVGSQRLIERHKPEASLL